MFYIIKTNNNIIMECQAGIKLKIIPKAIKSNTEHFTNTNLAAKCFLLYCEKSL